MLGRCAAAPADDLRAGRIPLPSLLAKCIAVSFTMPAILGGIVDLTRIGVDQDWLAGGTARRADERWDKWRGSTIHADRRHLRVIIQECRAIGQALAMANVRFIACAEAYPRAYTRKFCEQPH